MSMKLLILYELIIINVILLITKNKLFLLQNLHQKSTLDERSSLVFLYTLYTYRIEVEKGVKKVPQNDASSTKRGKKSTPFSPR